MRNEKIFRHLQEFIAEERNKPNSSIKPKMLSLLETITVDGIRLGEAPKYFSANMVCNATGVGTSSFKGTETQRTVSLDYVTDTYFFIDGHEGAAKTGLSLFHLKEGQTIRYWKKKDIEERAWYYGFQLHRQKFADLNFTLNNCRLNRYKVNVTEGPFSYPIYPILALPAKRKTEMTIGYIYEKNGQDYIILDPSESWAEEEEKSGCAPWMYLGFIFPPIFIVALLVWLFKGDKD